MRNKLTGALMLIPAAAGAHVTLAQPSAQPGARYEAHFVVGHGCGGTSPTVALRVALPANVSAIVPLAQPGWTLSTEWVGGHLAAVTWKGDSLVAKGEFVLAMTLPKTNSLLAFPVTQTCQDGTESWNDVPVSGQKSTHPAPMLAVGLAPVADTMAAMPGMTMGSMAMGANKPAPGIAIHDAWIRALPAGLPSGGYFTLHNGGKNDAVLIGADSPACGMLMLHRSDDKGGMSQMRDVPQVPLAAGGTVEFGPGGYHLMCTDAKPVLKPGATVTVNLHFQDGAVLQAPFAVRNAAGK